MGDRYGGARREKVTRWDRAFGGRTTEEERERFRVRNTPNSFTVRVIDDYRALRARVSELEKERERQEELRGYIAEISRAIDDDTLRGRVDSIFAILEGQLRFTTDGELGALTPPSQSG